MSEQREEQTVNEKVEQLEKDDRCAINRDVYNDVQVMASAQKLSNCEMQTELIKYGISRAKLRAACQAGDLRPEECKCLD